MKKLWASGFIAVTLFLLCIGIGAAAESISGPSPSQVQQDPYMYTKQFQTKVVVGNDGSYDITEKINVRFLEERHGIYRYIPSKGTIASYDKKGEIQKTPFYASVKLVRANETVDESSENGSTVFRFGDEDKTVREGIYKFEYLLSPKFQQKSYDNIYYNIFPTQWQNQIPAGNMVQQKMPGIFSRWKKTKKTLP